MITRLLKGHVSEETAYLVDDYPYGFRLRCKIRYWVEYKKNFGFRFVSQTTNPKKAGTVWNIPKKSTYWEFGLAMYLDEEGHVTYAGLSKYSDAAEARKFYEQFKDALLPEQAEITLEWVELKELYEKDPVNFKAEWIKRKAQQLKVA